MASTALFHSIHFQGLAGEWPAPPEQTGEQTGRFQMQSDCIDKSLWKTHKVWINMFLWKDNIYIYILYIYIYSSIHIQVHIITRLAVRLLSFRKAQQVMNHRFSQSAPMCLSEHPHSQATFWTSWDKPISAFASSNCFLSVGGFEKIWKICSSKWFIFPKCGWK